MFKCNDDGCKGVYWKDVRDYEGEKFGYRDASVGVDMGKPRNSQSYKFSFYLIFCQAQKSKQKKKHLIILPNINTVSLQLTFLFVEEYGSLGCIVG